MKVIAISNHKGGCAKTTTALNVAVTLASTGSKVLAVDMDFQGNLSSALGADLQELEDSHKTVHRLMLDERADFSQYLFTCRPRLDLLPSCLDSETETLLDGQLISRELMLRQKIAPAQAAYDYCVIDTPPNLRVPTLNALAISDLTIMPIESSVFALLGLKQLMRVIARVRKVHKPDMTIMGLSTMYTSRQNLDKDVRARTVDILTENFIFRTTIPRAVAIGEAVGTLQAVVESSPESPGAFAFRKLVEEIREIIGDEEIRPNSTKRNTK